MFKLYVPSPNPPENSAEAMRIDTRLIGSSEAELRVKLFREGGVLTLEEVVNMPNGPPYSFYSPQELGSSKNEKIFGVSSWLWIPESLTKVDSFAIYPVLIRRINQSATPSTLLFIQHPSI